MRQTTETSLAEPSKVELLAPKAIGPDDRRHLTRFLTRHCAAVPLLDACVEGFGPLPGLMDRFISRVVDTHRQLSGGTFVDAGDRLEVHPQSLRVLSRKVRNRDIGEGSILAGTPQDWVQCRWKAVIAALLRDQQRFPIAQIAPYLASWTGPVKTAELKAIIKEWESEGWLDQRGGWIEATQVPSGPFLSRTGQASLIADHLADLSATFLGLPMHNTGKEVRPSYIMTRGPIRRSQMPAFTRALKQHLRQSIEQARKKYKLAEPGDPCIAIGLVIGTASQGLQGYGTLERDIWLNTLARHLARHGGLREAMPILYQEVARELRRRSVKRAYDVDLLKAVGRARQNVHEWEAGRGFHFRGPAPMTVVDDNSETNARMKIRQYATLFLQERSKRACKVYEISAFLQKEIGVNIEEQQLLRVLDEEIAVGAVKVTVEGSTKAYQAVKSHRRMLAQTQAQRRAGIEITIRSAADSLAGVSAARANCDSSFEMVLVKREHAIEFMNEMYRKSADYHHQMIGTDETLEPDSDNAIDVETVMGISPPAPVLGSL